MKGLLVAALLVQQARTVAPSALTKDQQQAVAQASQLVESQRAKLRMNPAETPSVACVTDPGSLYHVLFKRQVLKGVPVEYTGIDVAMLPDGHGNPGMIMGGIRHAENAPSAAPILNADNARAGLAGTRLAGGEEPGGPTLTITLAEMPEAPELVFLPEGGPGDHDGALILAWKIKVNLPGTPRQNWYVDAAAGRVLDHEIKPDFGSCRRD